MQRYNFARFFLSVTNEDPNEYLLEAIQHHETLLIGDFRWGFFDSRELRVEGEDLLFGYLVKYKPHMEIPTVDETQGRRTEAEIDDARVAEAPFFIHVQRHILMFHPVSNQISIKQFQDNFGSLLRNHRDNMLVAFDLTFMNERANLFNEIRQLDKLMSLKIELWPSNPTFEEDWENPDQRLKRLKAKRLSEELESDDGLKIEVDTETKEHISMVEAGYGEASAVGIDTEGQEVKLHSVDFPAIEEVPNIKDATEEGVAIVLLKALQRIIRGQEDG